MILIIKENNKQSYEDHYEWIEKVYEIPDEKIEGIKNDYINFIQEKFKLKGMEVYSSTFPDYLSFYLSNKHFHSTLSEYEAPIVKKKDKKLFDKILKENNFYDWIEANYHIKPLLFLELHVC